MELVECYVDKTGFIKDFVSCPLQNLILRPRGFGKSTNLQMLFYFLSNTRAKEDIFKNCKIYKDRQFFQNHFRQYPVIYLSFKDLKGGSWEEMRYRLWDCLKTEAESHNLKIDLDQEEEHEELTFFLLTLSRELRQKYDKLVYVLIDDYDTPLNCAFLHGFYPEASEFFLAFYSAGLEDNCALASSCLMGTAEISAAGLPSQLGIFLICDVTCDCFSEYFGFWPEEIAEFCSETLHHEDYMKWYNGYRVGDSIVLNPWSIESAARHQSLGTSWAKSAVDVALIDKFFLESAEVVAAVTSSVNDPEYRHQIRMPNSYGHFAFEKWWTQDNIWSFLIFTGYLTVEQGPANHKKERVGYARIPNYELRLFWKDHSKARFGRYLEQYDSSPSTILNAFLEKDMATLRNFSSIVISNYKSFHEVKGGDAVLVLLVGLIGEVFSACPGVQIVPSIRLKYGKADVISIELPEERLKILFYLKVSFNGEDLDRRAQAALDQLLTLEYNPLEPGWSCLAIGGSFHAQQVSNLYYGVLNSKQNPTEIT